MGDIDIQFITDCHYKNIRDRVIWTRQMYFPQNLRARNIRSRCQQGWILLRSLSLACRWPTSPCVFTWLSLILISSYKDTGDVGPGPTHMISFYLNYLFKDPISKCIHILRFWGLACQRMNMVCVGWEHNSANKTLVMILAIIADISWRVTK